MTAIDVHAFRVETDHAVLRGEWAGDGSAVVLLHAGVCDRRMWDAEFADLAERHRVVRYDLRGTGESIPEARTDGEPFAHYRDVLAVLDALGLDRATLVGCSMGGRIALDATLTAPDRVAGLVMVCSRPSGAPPDPTIRPMIDRINEALDGGDIAAANEQELRLWVDGPHRPATAVDPDLRPWVGSMNLPSLASGWDGLGEQDLHPPAVDRLNEVGCLVLVMVGELDVAETVGSGEHMAREIAGARLVRFPDSAHLPSLEEPDRFRRHLTDFLTDVPLQPDDAVDRPGGGARAFATTGPLA